MMRARIDRMVSSEQIGSRRFTMTGALQEMKLTCYFVTLSRSHFRGDLCKRVLPINYMTITNSLLHTRFTIESPRPASRFKDPENNPNPKIPTGPHPPRSLSAHGTMVSERLKQISPTCVGPSTSASCFRRGRVRRGGVKQRFAHRYPARVGFFGIT